MGLFRISQQCFYLKVFNRKGLNNFFEGKAREYSNYYQLEETKLMGILRKNWLYLRQGSFMKNELEKTTFEKYKVIFNNNEKFLGEYFTKEQEQEPQEYKDYIKTYKYLNDKQKRKIDKEYFKEMNNKQLSFFGEEEVEKDKLWDLRDFFKVVNIKPLTTPLLGFRTPKELALSLFPAILDFTYLHMYKIPDKDKRYFTTKYAALALWFMERWEVGNMKDNKYKTLVENELQDLIDLLFSPNLKEAKETRDFLPSRCSYF